MKPQTNKEIFNRLISEEPSTWQQEAEWREENESWLANSFKIALKILNVLRERSLSQKELAEKMLVSPQHINKILKGQENLSLETINKIERALNITLIDIPAPRIFNEFTYKYDSLYMNLEKINLQSFTSFITCEYEHIGMSFYDEKSEHISEKIAA